MGLATSTRNGSQPAAFAALPAPRSGYGVIVNVVVLVDTPSKAETVTVMVRFTTLDVLMLKEALVAPPATVTLDGSEALFELSDNVMTVPPTGAGPTKVTVPVVEFPPFTELGLTDSSARPGETLS